MNPLFLGVGLVAFLIVVFIIRYPMLGLLLIIVVNPIDHLLAETAAVNVGRPIGIAVALGWVIGVIVNRRTHLVTHVRLNAILLSFAAVMIASTLVSREPVIGMYSVLTLLLLMAMSFFVQDFVRTRDDLRRLIWVVALALGASAFVGIYQFRAYSAGEAVMGDVMTYRTGVRFAGLRGNPNGYAMMLLSGVPFVVMLATSARKRYRWLMAVIALASFASIVLTASRTNVAGVIAFLGIYLTLRYARRGRMATMVAMLLVLVVGAIVLFQYLPRYTVDRLTSEESYQDGSTRARVGFYFKAFDLWADHPILGIGVGNFKFYEPYKGMGEHDVYSAVIAAVGTVGTLLFAAIVLATLFSAYRAIDRFQRRDDPFLTHLSQAIFSAFASLLIAGMGHNMLYNRMFWIYVALAAILSKSDRYALEQPDHERPPPLADESEPPLPRGLR